MDRDKGGKKGKKGKKSGKKSGKKVSFSCLPHLICNVFNAMLRSVSLIE